MTVKFQVSTQIINWVFNCHNKIRSKMLITKLTNTYLHFVYRHLTVNLCHLAAFLLCLFQHLFLHFHLAISIWPESDRNILCLDSDFLDDLPADRIFLSFCLLENWLEAVQIQPEIKNKFFSSVLSLNNHNQKTFIFSTAIWQVFVCDGSPFGRDGSRFMRRKSIWACNFSRQNTLHVPESHNHSR